MSLSQAKSCLGIDIGEDCLNLLWLKHSADKEEVSCVDSFSISEMPDERVAENLRLSLKKMKSKIPSVILTISVNLAITKIIQIPSVKDNEIRDILNLQAGRHTPYSREEIIVDYINLGSFEGMYTKVLVVMVPREAVRKRVNILALSGLKVNKVLFAAEGVGRMFSGLFRPPSAGAAQAILNLDRDSSDFNIFDGRGLIFVRSIPVGMRQLKFDKDAGALRLSEELKKTLEAYQSEDIAPNPAVLYISGLSQALYRDIEKVLGADLKLQVMKFDPLNHIKVHEVYEKFFTNEDMPSCIPLVCALASEQKAGIDLVPEEVKLHQKYEDKAKKITWAGVLLVVIFFQVCLYFILKIYYAEEHTKKLEARFKEKVSEAEKLNALSEKTRLLRNYLDGKNDAVDTLSKLYELMPDEINLKGIKFDPGGKIFIRGTSVSMSRIFAFVTELENDDSFKGVKTEFTESRKEEGKDVSDFGISMTAEENR